MKILYNLKSIFVALFSIVMLSSCSESTDSTQVGKSTDMSLSVVVSGRDANTLTFKVEPSTGIGNYMVGVVTQEEFDGLLGGDYTALASYLQDNYGALVNYSFVDYLYIYSGYNSVNIAKIWDLDPASSYIAVAFGVTDSGEVNSDVYYQEFTTNSILSYSDLVGSVCINEIYAVGNEDWIEFYNTSDKTINLGGFSFTAEGIDEAIDTYTFPSGTTIAPQSYLVIDQTTDFDFGISKGGEYIIFYDDNDDIVDEIDFSGVSDDSSYGRLTDGDSAWVTFISPTKGLDNTTKIAIEPEPYYGEMNMFVTKTTTSNITVKVERNDYTGYYIAFPYDLASFYYYYGGDPDSLALAISYSLISSYTLDQLVSYQVAYNRDATISNLSSIWTTFEDAEPGDEFIIVAFGLDETGDLTTETAFVTASLALE